jgi:hypothetical protein
MASLHPPPKVSEFPDDPDGVVVVVGSVRGDDTDSPTVDSSIELVGGLFLFPPKAFVNARRTAICFAGLQLSLSVNLHARIASGTFDAGHRFRYATVAAIRLSIATPFPDMITNK